MKRLGLVALGAVFSTAPAHAQVDPVESLSQLVTGNGFGFQVFDVDDNAIRQYLERPYRYLRANPSNPDGEGIVRRNLAFDTIDELAQMRLRSRQTDLLHAAPLGHVDGDIAREVGQIQRCRPAPDLRRRSPCICRGRP